MLTHRLHDGNEAFGWLPFLVRAEGSKGSTLWRLLRESQVSFVNLPAQLFLFSLLPQFSPPSPSLLPSNDSNFILIQEFNYRDYTDPFPKNEKMWGPLPEIYLWLWLRVYLN